MIDEPGFMCGTAAWQSQKIERDVGPEDAFHLVGRDLGIAVVRHLEGGVVDEDVEAAELAHGPLDQLPAVLRVADVACDRDALPARLLDDSDRLLRVRVLFE